MEHLLPTTTGADVRHLPTPAARDSKGPSARRPIRTNGRVRTEADATLADAVLLPTPTAERYGTNRSVSPNAATRPSLFTLAASELLPTVLPDSDSANGHARHLAGEAADEWGPYAAAVHRQEQAFGRPAPPPTQPGPNGGRQLSPAFTEWMQAWPAGWVTGVPGLTRPEQIKICGNGVVTPQAAAAIDDLVAIALQSVGVDATLGT